MIFKMFFFLCVCLLPIIIHRPSRGIFLNGGSHHASPLLKTLYRLPIALRLESRVLDIASRFLPAPSCTSHNPPRTSGQVLGSSSIFLPPRFCPCRSLCTCSFSIYLQPSFLCLFLASLERLLPQGGFSWFHGLSVFFQLLSTSSPHLFLARHSLHW